MDFGDRDCSTQRLISFLRIQARHSMCTLWLTESTLGSSTVNSTVRSLRGPGQGWCHTYMRTADSAAFSPWELLRETTRPHQAMSSAPVHSCWQDLRSIGLRINLATGRSASPCEVHMKFLCIIMTLMIAGVAPRVLAQRLIVTNPLDVDRPPQVVEIPLEQVLNRLHLSLDQPNSIVAEASETARATPHPRSPRPPPLPHPPP